MKHNETLRYGPVEQKVWGSSPYGCASYNQRVMRNLDVANYPMSAQMVPEIRERREDEPI